MTEASYPVLGPCKASRPRQLGAFRCAELCHPATRDCTGSSMKLPEQCSPVDIWVASDSVIHIRNRWTVRHHSEESSPR